jgi:MFS family permease
MWQCVVYSSMVAFCDFYCQSMPNSHIYKRLLMTIRKKLDKSILVANSIEHFSTSLYSFITPLIAQDFFSNHDHIVGLILSYSVYLSSVVTRPLGALIFGFTAIKKSPLIGLKISLLFTAGITILIALIPAYIDIGFWSPLLLTLCIFAKGIFTAGESCIAKLMLLDDKSKEKTFESSYYYQFSSMVGMILASLCATIIFSFDLPTYSWRILFIFSGIILIFATRLRFQLNQQISVKIKTEVKLYSMMNSNKINFLKIALTTAMSHVTYIIPFVLLNNLIPQITDVNLVDMMSTNTMLLVLDMLMIPVVGKFLKGYDPEKIMIISLVCMLFSIPIMMLFLPNANIYYIIFFRIWVVFLGVIFMCPQNIYYNNMFNNHSKYLIVGISSSVGAATIGKISTPISLYFWHISGNLNFIALYFGLVILSNIIVIMKK